MSRITRFSCKIENFGDLTCVKHHTNSLPVNSPMQCIMVSPNLILGCQPQLSETRLAKGQLVLDKAPRPSISNVITYHLSSLFVSSTNYFQIVTQVAKGQLVFPLLVHELITFSQKSSFKRLARNQLYGYGMVWAYICPWELLVVYISIEKRGKVIIGKCLCSCPFIAHLEPKAVNFWHLWCAPFYSKPFM